MASRDRAIRSNVLKNSELKTTHNTFRDCRVHFFSITFLEIAVINGLWLKSNTSRAVEI